MRTAHTGATDIAIALLKAKADVNVEDKVRVGLAGWMVVSVQRLSTISGVECAGAKVECRGRVVHFRPVSAYHYVFVGWFDAVDVGC